MRRPSLQHTRTIITGASSGIGQALARQLAASGADLLVTARRADRLRALSGELQDAPGTVHWLAGDITSESHRADVLTAAEQRLGGLDLLINNAGVGAYGPFADADADRLRQIMEVNFFAPLELARAAYPLLRGGRRPMLVQISSVLGHFAVPDKSEYCASKFALHGVSDALYVEWKQHGIDVLQVSPSTTHTSFVDALLDNSTGTVPRRRRGMTADQVARVTVRAIRRGRREVILSPGGTALVWLDRLCPPLMSWILRRWSG